MSPPGPTGWRTPAKSSRGVAAALGCAASDVLIASTGRDRSSIPDGSDSQPASLPSRRRCRARRRSGCPRDHDDRHGPQDCRDIGRRGSHRRRRQGRRDDRTEHGHDDHAAADRCRRSTAHDLDSIFRRVVDRTFNCVSIDTDTSTSDTAIVMASGTAGAVDLDAFERGSVRGRLVVDEADRPRRRGRREADRGDGRSGAPRPSRPSGLPRRSSTRRSSRPRCTAPTQLGPGGNGDRQVDNGRRGRPVEGGHPLRRSRGLSDDRWTKPVSMRCRHTCAVQRSASL